MSKFVQIAVAPPTFENELESLFALDEDGGVWQYDHGKQNWWKLGSGRISDEATDA